MTTSTLPELKGATAKETKAAYTRGTLTRAVIVAALMIAGFGGSLLLERSLHLTFDKPPMPLSKPLSEMSRRFGPYSADGPDEVMDDETVDVLGTKDYLLRTYTDNSKKPDDVGARLALNLNYYATGNSSPHVPEICWAGTGMNEAPSSRRYFDVENVARKDGTVITLKMRMISFLPRHDVDGGVGNAAKDASQLLNVAYVFEVNGNYVATPQEVSSLFWVASNKHAYHTKIEVTVPGYSTQEEAIAVISDYMRAALPAVEECLPSREAAEVKATAAMTPGVSGREALAFEGWSRGMSTREAITLGGARGLGINSLVQKIR